MNRFISGYWIAIVLVLVAGYVPRTDPLLETNPREWRASDWSVCPATEEAPEERYVYVIGDVAQPNRYAWCPGMRLGDAIRSAGGPGKSDQNGIRPDRIFVSYDFHDWGKDSISFGTPLSPGAVVRVPDCVLF
ncbi:MAG: hypothetical protein R3C97_04420 [Geminicoccaceae bacterium]